MRIKNPSYDPKGMEGVKAQILTEFSNRPAVESVTFDQLRAFFTKTAVEWPDVYITEKLSEWGFSVVD